MLKKIKNIILWLLTGWILPLAIIVLAAGAVVVLLLALQGGRKKHKIQAELT